MATDRLTKLLERSARLDAQIRDAKARVKDRERKRDTRAKIMAGANALDLAKRKPAFREELAEHMNRTVTRPEDRAMYDFLDGMAPPPRPAAPAASDGFADAAAPPDPDKKREMESS